MKVKPVVAKCSAESRISRFRSWNDRSRYSFSREIIDGSEVGQSECSIDKGDAKAWQVLHMMCISHPFTVQ